MTPRTNVRFPRKQQPRQTSLKQGYHPPQCANVTFCTRRRRPLPKGGTRVLRKARSMTENLAESYCLENKTDHSEPFAEASWIACPLPTANANEPPGGDAPAECQRKPGRMRPARAPFSAALSTSRKGGASQPSKTSRPRLRAFGVPTNPTAGDQHASHLAAGRGLSSPVDRPRDREAGEQQPVPAGVLPMRPIGAPRRLQADRSPASRDWPARSGSRWQRTLAATATLAWSTGIAPARRYLLRSRQRPTAVSSVPEGGDPSMPGQRWSRPPARRIFRDRRNG